MPTTTVNRTRPVRVFVPDATRATVEAWVISENTQRKTAYEITGTDRDDTGGQVNAQLAAIAAGARAPVPVTFFDNHPTEGVIIEWSVVDPEGRLSQDPGPEHMERDEADFTAWATAHHLPLEKPDPALLGDETVPVQLIAGGNRPLDEVPVPTTPAPSPAPTKAPAPTFALPAPEEMPVPVAEVTGWRATAHRLGWHVGPSKAEAAHTANLATLRGGWYGPKVVTVLNRKGGTGKSTVLWGVMATMAEHTGRRVVIADFNESGNVHHLVGTPETIPTVKALARLQFGTDRVVSPRELDDVVTVPPYDRYHLVRGATPTSPFDRMTVEEATAAHMALQPTYHAIGADTGNVLTDFSTVGTLQFADQLVVPVPTSDEQGAETTLASLSKWGEDYFELCANAVVVVTTTAPEDGKVAKRLAREWAGKVRAVHVLPYDPALRRTPLRLAALAPATARAFVGVAAAVVRGLNQA